MPALAYQMVSNALPSPNEDLSPNAPPRCSPDRAYNKLSVFDPEAILEAHYAVGRHRAAPEGRGRYPKRDRLLPFH